MPSHRKRDSVGIGTRFIEAESRRIFPFIHQRITTIVRPDAPCFDGTRTAAHRERPAHDHFAGAGHVPFRCTGDSDRTAKDDPGGRSNDASGYRFSAGFRTTVHRPARICPGHSSCGACLVGQIRHRPYVRSSQRPHRSRRRTRAGDRTHRADPFAPQEEQPDPDRRSRRGQERHRRRAGPADGSGRSSRHYPRQAALLARRIVARGRDQIQR